MVVYGVVISRSNCSVIIFITTTTLTVLWIRVATLAEGLEPMLIFRTLVFDDDARFTL